MTIRFDHRRLQFDSIEQGLSAAQLARRAGVVQTSVSRFFRGGAIRPTTAKRLAAALGYPVQRYVLTDDAGGVDVPRRRAADIGASR